jgi:hypothetical protein
VDVNGQVSAQLRYNRKRNSDCRFGWGDIVLGILGLDKSSKQSSIFEARYFPNTAETRTIPGSKKFVTTNPDKTSKLCTSVMP